MRALHATGDGKLALIDVPEPIAGAGQALVRIEASALCGSERSAVRTGMPGAPFNAGHEACGIVESLPSGSGFRVGDRVAISALAGCSACEACRRGQEMFCTDGVTVQLGMHAERVAVDCASLRALPPGVTPGIGALLGGDALGVPVRALNRVGSVKGDRVIVVGLGPVGLSHVLVRVHAGAQVTAIDPIPGRRELARSFGATEVLEPGDKVMQAALVIEATGAPKVVADAFNHVAPRGTLLQSGECGSVEIPVSQHIVHREVAYLGTWFYGSEDYPRMLSLVAEGLPVDRLLTHEAPPEDSEALMAAFLSGQTGKAVIRWA